MKKYELVPKPNNPAIVVRPNEKYVHIDEAAIAHSAFAALRGSRYFADKGATLLGKINGQGFMIRRVGNEISLDAPEQIYTSAEEAIERILASGEHGLRLEAKTEYLTFGGKSTKVA